jgi:hypothetical protein
MSQELIDRSKDLKRLRDEGYEIEIREGYLFAHEIPYVNLQKEVKRGTLVAPLDLAGDITVKPSTHVIYFIGEQPCNAEGDVIRSISHNDHKQNIGNGIEVDRSFSSKPPDGTGYPDFYEKFITYIKILISPVHLIDPLARPETFKVIESTAQSIFNYYDTNSSRANIGAVCEKLSGQKIGVVGLGGTGSYILDFVAKTPVAEIHLFDGDYFYQHNAFRTPGAISKENLKQKEYKVDYLTYIYKQLRNGIIPHNIFLGESTLDCLLSMDFVFLCVDSSNDKKIIIDSLVEKQIPFIDTGIGVNLNVKGDSLLSTIRVTSVFNKANDGWKTRISYDNPQNDLYASNIQIAELNALCATLAIIEWKKHYTFYLKMADASYINYETSTGEMFNEN